MRIKGNEFDKPLNDLTPGEYTVGQETFDVTKEDIEHLEKWQDNYKDYHAEKKVFGVDKRNYADINVIEEYRNEDTTPERKEELKKIINKSQPLWSRFYDIEDLPSNINGGLGAWTGYGATYCQSSASGYGRLFIFGYLKYE